MSISRSSSIRLGSLAALFVLLLGLTMVASAATSVVEPLNSTTAVPANVCPGLVAENWADGWFACDENDGANASGNVMAVTGPATPPLGTGSAQFTVANTGDGPAMWTVYENGLRFDDITQMTYNQYYDSTSTSDDLVYLWINVDYDVTDASVGWQGRLVWVAGWAGCSTLVPDTWQLYDPENNATGCWLQTGTPVVGDVGQAATWPHIGGTAATWAQILSTYPDAGIHSVYGAMGFKMGSGQPATVAAIDAFTFAFDAGAGEVEQVWDFEPQTVCTTVCYADAVGGNDANGGSSPATAKKTIQAAIDAVSAGGEVRVLPGTYDETASGRFLFDASGPYQFGLFIQDDTKDGISILGVTAGDVEITDPTLTEAAITTNATNSFGAAGIWVEADDVTIAGLEIGPNIPGDNKTIEIAGEAFTLKNSFVNVPGGGSIYFGDWRYDTGSNTSYITEYTVDNNVFSDGTSVDISNGAGYSGPVAGRNITNNVFSTTTGQYWPSISFNGDTTTVPWYVYPVSGAIITGNSFTNLNLVDGIHIRTRGVADDSTFDWASYWNDNTYNKAVVVGVNPPNDVRSWSYTTSYTFNDVRMIGAVIQPGIDIAQAGDTVLVKAGTYPESPNVDESVTLLGEDGRDNTTIELQTGPTYLGSLTIIGPDVTVDGFTIQGLDAACPTLATSNIYVEAVADDVTIQNNRIQVGLAGACSNGDDGFGILTTYEATHASDVTSVLVDNNIIEPLTASGATRAFYVNPGVALFTFSNNSVTGKFDGTAITQANNSVIEDNTVTGDGTSAGLGTWGYPDPTTFGAAEFSGNTITMTANAISVFESDDVNIHHNILHDNGRAVRVTNSIPLAFDLSTIHINRNSIVGNTTEGVSNLLSPSDDIDGMCNWWGAADGPGPVGPGSGDTVSDDVDFSDWLYTDNLDGPCGVPPVSNVCPVDANVGYLMTDALGIGQGGPTKGFRTRKLVLPNYTEIDSIYGQLAAVDVGVMKYVRFLPQGEPKVQIHAPTSQAYQKNAVSWWGSDLPATKWIKGQFFWGSKGNKSPRAFVLWPTYNTTEQYANAFVTFDDSSTNMVAWEPAWIPTQVQTFAIPETQTEGAEVNVTVALVDVNKDGRSVELTVEVGGVSQSRTITVPNEGLSLNLEDFTFNNVAAGVNEVEITLHSPDGTGDSAAMIGAAANYECVEVTPVQ